MHFYRFFASVLGLLFSLNFALASGLASTRTTSSPLEARSLLGERAVVAGTLCATVDVRLNVLGVDRLLVSQICLCTEAGVLTDRSVADLRAALQVQASSSTSVVSLVLRLLGTTVDGLVTTLRPILGNQIGGQPATCDYPPNSSPICGGSCTFECKSGFYNCGGQCIATGRTCISNSPGPVQRKRTRIPTCPNGWTACIVEGSSMATPSFECVNTKADIDSCGGCLHGFVTRGGLIEPKGSGEACTAIPGANDISCINSACQVFSCLRGWVLQNGTCVRKTTSSHSSSHGIYFQQ